MRADVRTLAHAWSAIRGAMVERMGEQEVRWRSLGVLYCAGGSLALLSLPLPYPPGASRGAIAALGLCAIASALLMIAAARRLPSGEGWLSLLLGFGSVLVTLAVFFTHAIASPFALLYVWVGFEAFFFLSRRAASAHLLFLGASYAAALVAMRSHEAGAAAHWLLLMGTVGMVGALADVLRERADRLIERLGEAARTDALTELLNRRGFEQLMEDELARALRHGRPLSLVVGDLDHFKMINDRFGHGEGDRTLQRFSELVRATKRTIDGAARIGGEEFALVLPDTDEHGAYLLAERLRREIREAAVADERVLSISFGVVTHPAHGTTTADLLHNADQALYVAKRLGRDRSVIYSPEVAANVRTSPEPDRVAVEQVAAVLVLAETLDLRDTGTAQHSQTVGRYTESVALELGFDAARVERVRMAGLLHDVGKIGVPDPVLRKPGPLDDAEWAEMRKHPELGARILAGARLDDISAWVLAHHERPDGRGYPRGLVLEEIPLEARILAVADAFEAMTSDRVYRAGMPREDAVAELRRQVGAQFDGAVVGAFLAVLGEAPLTAIDAAVA